MSIEHHLGSRQRRDLRACDRVGFKSLRQQAPARVDDEDVLTHGEMATDRGLIMLATPTPDYEGPLQPPLPL